MKNRFTRVSVQKLLKFTLVKVLARFFRSWSISHKRTGGYNKTTWPTASADTPILSRKSRTGLSLVSKPWRKIFGKFSIRHATANGVEWSKATPPRWAPICKRLEDRQHPRISGIPSCHMWPQTRNLRPGINFKHKSWIVISKPKGRQLFPWSPLLIRTQKTSTADSKCIPTRNLVHQTMHKIQ